MFLTVSIALVCAGLNRFSPHVARSLNQTRISLQLFALAPLLLTHFLNVYSALIIPTLSVAQMILAVRTIGLSALLGFSEIDTSIPDFETLSARTSFVQVLQVVAFLVLIGVRGSNIALSADIIPTVDSGTAFVPLVRLSFRYAVENAIGGVCACLIWFRLFKYLSFVPRVTFVQLMFRHAMSELVVFTIIVLVFLVQQHHDISDVSNRCYCIGPFFVTRALL